MVTLLCTLCLYPLQVQDQRIVVGDWVPTSSSSSGDGNSSKSSSESIGCGGGSGAEKSDSGDGGEKADSGGGGGNSTSESSGGESRGSGSGGGASVAYLYALIYTAEQRNGQLVVTQLGPNALDAAADASGSRVGGGGGASGSKPAAPAPAPVGDGGARGSGGAEPGSPEGGGAAGNGTAGPYWALLQAHSWDVELVDLEGGCQSTGVGCAAVRPCCACRPRRFASGAVCAALLPVILEGQCFIVVQCRG